MNRHRHESWISWIWRRYLADYAGGALIAVMIALTVYFGLI